MKKTVIGILKLCIFIKTVRHYHHSHSIRGCSLEFYVKLYQTYALDIKVFDLFKKITQFAQLLLFKNSKTSSICEYDKYYCVSFCHIWFKTRFLISCNFKYFKSCNLIFIQPYNISCLKKITWYLPKTPSPRSEI